MSDSKLTERFSTPNSSKLAQILLDLRGVDGAQPGLCNLQPSDVTLWPEVFGGVWIVNSLFHIIFIHIFCSLVISNNIP